MLSSILTASLVLITLDTTRLDYINEEYAPNLAREKALRFSYAVSAATWTIPAHASIFSGRLPSEMVDLRNESPKDTWIDLFDNPAAVVSVRFLDLFQDEFEIFNAPEETDPGVKGVNRRSAVETTDIALGLLGSHDFLWVHYWSPHEYERDWARYGELVSVMDLEVGRLLERIPGESWVIILADHGESRLRGHFGVLEDEVVRIPFLIRGGGLDGVSDGLISQLDVRAIVESLILGELSIPVRAIAATEMDDTRRLWTSRGVLGDFPMSNQPPLDQETVDQLKALGYIGGVE